MFLQARVNVTRGVMETISLDTALRAVNNGVNNNAVVVMATEDIIVYGLNSDSQSADAFTTYPVDALGDTYHVVVSDENPAVLVCGSQDNTMVFVCSF